jgi:ABC-type polysaccharide/polyol phosphate transport system ATPase subunit
LIGRNGAGKTTLLKLINGLIRPTKGKITINGTIGALIALGTGFNPILTGRENVKIAGAVLGISEKQINKNLDEILEFSEIGDFIDAPVKSYSSGMLVRLGFSVAIQLNPDILLVDEVLAVGDLSFAVKCHKKITEYKNNGGSMILVSHGMHNVRFHCDKAIWIDNAKIMEIGESNTVCNEFEMFVGREANQKGEILYFDDSIKLGNFNHTKVVKEDEEFIFEFEVRSKRYIEKPILVFSIYDVKGQHLFKNYSHLDNFALKFDRGITKIRIKYGQMPLSNGVYNINLIIHENEINNHLVFCQRRFSFEIQREEPILGLLSLKPEWNMEPG